MGGYFLKRLVGVRASILTQFQTKICTELPLSCFRADIEIDTQQYIEQFQFSVDKNLVPE